MARLTISLLGRFQVALNGEPITAFESDKVRALLAYLAVEAHQPHRRETLAGLLWPERPERSARHSLSQALLNVRHAIQDRLLTQDCDAASPFLLITHQAIQFNADSDFTLDATAFTALLNACDEHRHDEMETCDPCMERLRQAVALYQGGLLEGFSLADSLAFEEWALLQREHLHRLAIDALQRLTDCYEGRGKLDQALQHAWRLVELDPWQEKVHRQLMRLLALSGRRNAALKQYRAYRRMLADELGIEPDAKTTELFEQIRDGRYERPESPRQKKNTENGGLSKSQPFRLPARVVILVVFLLSSLDLLAGFLKPNSNQTAAYSCTVQTDIRQTGCQALVTLYNETGGSGWKDSHGWLSDATPCNWFGVTCSGGSVTELNLPGNNLSGHLPKEIGLLTNLSVLNLESNQLGGSIPPELGSLSYLRSLSLTGNSQLSGTIPPELGNLARLELLSLSRQERGSQLSGPIPPELGNLRRLTWLELSNSLVSGPIPAELGNLTSLMSLDLSYNLLSGPIPPELGNLSDLKYLSLCGNGQLSGPIPPELGDLIRLESLCLSSDNEGGTLLSGPIPPELGNLGALRYLDLSNSLVSGPIPPELGNLTNLTFLSIVQNPLSGPLPSELGNLVNLQVLSVGEGPSELAGRLPLSLMNLRLEYFTYGTNTGLCEPPDAAFQEWLDSIPTLDGPRAVCQSEG